MDELRRRGYDLRRTGVRPADDASSAETGYRPLVRERLGKWTPPAWDVALGAAVAVLAEVEGLSGQVDGPRGALLPLGLLMTLPLAFRRRSPLLVLAVVMVSFVSQTAAGVDLQSGSLASVVAGLVAVYTVAAHVPLQLALVGGAFAYAVTAATALRGPGGLAWGLLLIGGAWLAGRALRSRREQVEAAVEHAAALARERESLAREAVAEERVRIARELHDVVTHAVSVIVVQAGAAEQVLAAGADDPREALRSIQTTGRQALRELRRLLGVLRTEDVAPTLGPQPGLGALGELAESVRQAGTPVAVHVEGLAPLPAGLDLAAFRIVQEALTNVLKHAPGREASVGIAYRGDVLELEVANIVAHADGDAAPGHGLIGMRERALLYGGELAVGRDAGRFVVRARLPLDTAT